MKENAPPEAVGLPRQLCVYMTDHLAQYGFSPVARYLGGTYAGIPRNAYGIAGARSVLVEMKGGIGQNCIGILAKHAVEQVEAILTATAVGSV